MTFGYEMDLSKYFKMDDMLIIDPNPDDPNLGDVEFTVEFNPDKKDELEEIIYKLKQDIVSSFQSKTITIETSGSINAKLGIVSPDFVDNVRYSSFVTTKSRSIKIQSSSNVGDHITIPLPGMDTEILGIDDVKVSSYEEASASIKKIHKAVNIASGIRSDFGAISNRLKAAMIVDDITAENTQAAESRLRDMDMATGGVEQAKNNILGQVIESMLAQANQSKNGVMTLLR